LRIAAALAVVGTLIAAGCGADSGASGDASEQAVPFKRTVNITHTRFEPARATVLVGGTVTWVNRDPVQGHTAETSNPRYRDLTGGENQAFDTHTLTWNEPYTVTFHKPGSFDYHCSLDPRMKGDVQVVTRELPR
jgi:plastocyanin